MIKILLLFLVILFVTFNNIEQYENVNMFLVLINYNNKIKIYNLYSSDNSFLNYDNFVNDLRKIFNKEFKKELTINEFEKRIYDYIKITDDDYNFKHSLCNDNELTNYNIKFQKNKYNDDFFKKGFTKFIS
jgi:hypothetical protein